MNPENSLFVNISLNLSEMKVHLIKRKTIEDYVAQNSGSRKAFENWLSKLKFADWNSPNDIMSTFGTADILGNGSDRVVFDIKGNNYRLICTYSFTMGNQVRLFVNWIGTHSKYDTLCKTGNQYNVNEF